MESIQFPFRKKKGTKLDDPHAQPEQLNSMGTKEAAKRLGMKTTRGVRAAIEDNRLAAKFTGPAGESPNKPFKHSKPTAPHRSRTVAISKASYDAAEKIRRDTTAQNDQIRNRRELTDAAKLSRIAKVHLAGAAQMKELQTTSVQTAKAQRAQAETRAFGVADLKGDSASPAISYRDALDRAAQLTSSKDAQALLSRAHRSGDEPLARATASHAFDMATSGASFTDSGWEDVVNNFLEQRPDLSDDVQTLATWRGRLVQPPSFSPTSSLRLPNCQESASTALRRSPKTTGLTPHDPTKCPCSPYRGGAGHYWRRICHVVRRRPTQRRTLDDHSQDDQHGDRSRQVRLSFWIPARRIRSRPSIPVPSPFASPPTTKSGARASC